MRRLLRLSHWGALAAASLGALLACARAPGSGPGASSSTPATSQPASDSTPAPASAPDDHGAQPAPANHAAGVDDPKLADLLQRHWEATLAASPRLATHLGDHRYDGRLEDNTPEGIAAWRASNRAFVAEARALEGLTGPDVTTRDLFVLELENEIAGEVCRFEEWTLSPRGNPITSFNYLAELHRVNDFEDAEMLVRRYEKAGGFIDNQTAALARGADDGVYANAESTRRVLTMLNDQLAKPVEAWPMFAPAKVDRPEWTDAQRGGFRQGLLDALTEGVKPALERYRDFIADQILPNARSDEEPGLTPLPFGAECYRARIHAFTTLPKTAKEVHETGLAEIARINGEMKKLGRELFGTRSLPRILERLRTDPKLYFDSAEAIETKASTALAKARARIEDAFGILPRADCIVSRIPDYEAPFTTIAYYRRPDPSGERPGQFFVNVYAPKTRPRYEMEALAFHEAIPGHHLQIAIAQERSTLPAFRRHGGMTAFVEGWALYAEQLSDEMGLYTGALDRMGMLSYEAWRASRLVVDTGLHAMGWSRDRAKNFMLEHTALAPNNVDNEVDRYIVWPGQAVAYKTGQLEIWRLRRDAEERLGDRFDIKGFHDAVLSGGAVSLPVLAKQVEAWVKSMGPGRE